MCPTIQMFGKEIPAYWLMSLLGILAAAVYALVRRRQLKLRSDDAVHFVALSAIGGIVGAKLLYLITVIPLVLQELPYFTKQPDRFLLLLQDGFVFYGGLYGALFFVWRYCRKYKVDFHVAAALFAGGVPLFHVFGRIGCFLTGCCYGIEANWGIAFYDSMSAPNGIPLVPVQLFEAGAELIIFIAVMIVQNRSKLRSSGLYLYLFTYALCRFVLEFFRGDAARGSFLFLSTSQWISAVTVLAILFLILRRRKLHNEPNIKKRES